MALCLATTTLAYSGSMLHSAGVRTNVRMAFGEEEYGPEETAQILANHAVNARHTNATGGSP